MFAKYSTHCNNTQKNSTAVRQILLLQFTSNVRKNNTFLICIFCQAKFVSAGTAKTFCKKRLLCASFKLSRQMQRGKTTHNFTVTFFAVHCRKRFARFSPSAMHVAVVLPRAMHKSKSTKLYKKRRQSCRLFSC